MRRTRILTVHHFVEIFRVFNVRRFQYAVGLTGNLETEIQQSENRLIAPKIGTNYLQASLQQNKSDRIDVLLELRRTRRIALALTTTESLKIVGAHPSGRNVPQRQRNSGFTIQIVFTFHPANGLTVAQFGVPSFPVPGTCVSMIRFESICTWAIISQVMPFKGILSRRPHIEFFCPA